MLVNLCGQEIKISYNGVKKERIADGQAAILHSIEDGQQISLAPVSRFRFHEKVQYAVIDIKSKGDRIMLIDSFPEADPTRASFRIKMFSQGEKLFAQLARDIEHINGTIKPRLEEIYESFAKGVVATKKEGKLEGLRLKGIGRETELAVWDKELQAYKNEIKRTEKSIISLFSMGKAQQKDFKNAFYFDLYSKVEKLLETIKKATAKLL